MHLTIRERRDRNILDNLLVAAEDVKLPKSSNRYRLAAAIIKKNRILGMGINNYCKSHPLQAKYAKHKKAIYPCAEVNSVHNAIKRHGREELRGATIYVARLRYANSKRTELISGLAYPCVGCQKHIKELGIKKIIYTLDDGNFACEEVGE